MAKDTYKTREATEAEVASMEGWVRWSYDRNLPVVLYPLDGVIGPMPTNRKVDPSVVIILQRGAVNGNRV